MEALDHFPSENVEYNATPPNQIKLLVDLLTSHTMKYARMSLDGDHQLLFNAIMCLAIQKKSEEFFSEEELSLLTQGVFPFYILIFSIGLPKPIMKMMYIDMIKILLRFN